MCMDIKTFLRNTKFEITEQDGAVVCIILDEHNFIFYRLKGTAYEKYIPYYDEQSNCFDTKTYLIAVSLDCMEFYPDDWECCSVNLNLLTNEEIYNRIVESYSSDDAKEMIENEEWLTCAEIIANNYFLS